MIYHIAVASLSRGTTNLGSANNPISSTAGDVGMRNSQPHLIPANSISSTSAVSLGSVSICKADPKTHILAPDEKRRDQSPFYYLWPGHL